MASVTLEEILFKNCILTISFFDLYDLLIIFQLVKPNLNYPAVRLFPIFYSSQATEGKLKDFKNHLGSNVVPIYVQTV